MHLRKNYNNLFIVLTFDPQQERDREMFAVRDSCVETVQGNTFVLTY